LEFIKKNYRVTLPGEKLSKKEFSLTLCFDDAYYSFYYSIFPILKRLKLRTLLAVSPKYIIESSSLYPKERLETPYSLRFQEGIFETKAPFCSWEELEEMTNSSLVQIASHGFVHGNLQYSFVDLHREIVQSKEILEKRLHQPIMTFVYPFGKYLPIVHDYVQRHYTYSYRIGGGCHWSWDSTSEPLMRIRADQMETPTSLLTFRSKLSYFLTSLLKQGKCRA
jgi:peptidoglycan/xylan/chitin deacetylase (PgdA/CDA1 family)